MTTAVRKRDERQVYESIEQQMQECVDLIKQNGVDPRAAIEALDVCILRWIAELRPNSKRNRKLLQSIYQWRSHVHTHLMKQFHLGYYDALRSLLLIDRKSIFDLHAEQKDISSLSAISKPIYVNNYRSFRLMSEACEGLGQYRFAMVYATNAFTSLTKNPFRGSEHELQLLRERMDALKPNLLKMLQTKKDRLEIVAFPMHTCMVPHPDQQCTTLVERAEAIRFEFDQSRSLLECACQQAGEGRIEIRQTADGGRGIFALKRIKTGQKVSYERRPLVSGSLPTEAQEYCDNCLAPLLRRASKTSGSSTARKEWRISRVDEVKVKKYLPNVVNCEHCIHAKYCSTECRELAWHKWHRVLCGRSCSTLRSYVALKSESLESASSNVKHPLLLIKFAAMHMAAQERKAQGVQQPDDTNVPPEVRQEMRMIELLCSLNDSRSRPKIEHIMSVNVNDRELVCEELDTLNDPTMDFRWFLDVRALVQANSFHACPTVIKQQDGSGSSKHTYNGIALYGLTSFYNHSCAPNATADIDEKGGHLVVAKKTIQPGEQIFISYCEPGMSFQDRQLDLLASYAFECKCDLCLKKQ